MDKQSGFSSLVPWIYSIVFGALLLFILLNVRHVDYHDIQQKSERVEFGKGWHCVKGKAGGNLRRIPAVGKGEELVYEKLLPETIQDDDTLNFNSHNVYFTLQIEGETTYSFNMKENPTGRGYGDSFHNIKVSGEMAGKRVTLRVRPAFAGTSSSGFESMLICNPQEYYFWYFKGHLISAVLSLLITFFGIVVFAIRFGVLRKNLGHYNLTALAVAIIELGLWTLLETKVPQMITGATIAIRMLSYVLLWSVGYPIVVFVNSLSQTPKKLYDNVALLLTMLNVAANVVLRYAFGIDMHSMIYLLHFAFVVEITFLFLILISNYRYCKRIELEDGLKYFYYGITGFAIGSLLEIAVYVLFQKSLVDSGLFLRFGLFVFIIFMFQQIMEWMGKEQKLARRNTFVNRLLQSSMSGDSPEKTISQMLEYFGREMRADRTYIFEDRWDGTFDNTYEWCKEGVQAELQKLKRIPYEGVLEYWYEEYEKSNYIVIKDLESYRENRERLYQILKAKGTRTLITGPLEVRGRYIGFFGVDNPPLELMDEIIEIMRLLSYFITAMIKQRDEQQELINYSYFDQLTGTKNRRALQEYLDHELKNASEYGFLMCDINGLKTVNDEQGHEAGDLLIQDVADVLLIVFGKNNVFRLGGDEFAAFGIWNEEKTFDNAVENVKLLMEAKGRSASLGFVYQSGKPQSFSAVKNKADKLMYADKEAYYKAHPEMGRRKKG